MSLPDLLTEIREDLKTLPAVARVYDDVPGSLNEWPAVIVASLGGRCWLDTHDGALMCEHDVRIEIHVPRKDLPADSDKIVAIASDVPIWLYEGFVTDRFNGTMITTGNPRTANNATNPIDYAIGPSQWGSDDTYAFICEFKVATEQEVGT